MITSTDYKLNWSYGNAEKRKITDIDTRLIRHAFLLNEREERVIKFQECLPGGLRPCSLALKLYIYLGDYLKLKGIEA